MRCGYCYTEGHNQTTCKEKTKYYRKMAEGSECEYYKKRYQERINPKKKKKKCGYCSEVGHTRRKCSKLEKDVDWRTSYGKNLHEANARSVKDLAAFGCGMGTLVRWQNKKYVNGQGYQERNLNVIATNVSYENQLFQSKTNPIIVFRSVCGEFLKVRASRVLAGSNEGWNSTFKLISPSFNQWVFDPQWDNLLFDRAKVKSHLFARGGNPSEDRRRIVYTNIEREQEFLDRPKPNYPSSNHKHNIEKAVEFLNRFSTDSIYESGKKAMEVVVEKRDANV
jgi:hypothetical protein